MFKIDRYREKIEEILSFASIEIDGPNPFDIQVHDSRLYARLFGGGTLALGESYMDGWWSCDELDEFFSRVLNAELSSKITTLKDRLFFVSAHLVNKQTVGRSQVVAQTHYDVGNDLFERMLDDRMIYTCAYWRDAQTLNSAQEHKLELVCRKLKLEKGMSVLDIGCGWGGAAHYMAEMYGVSVTGISNSQEQLALAKRRFNHDNINYRFLDYRDMTGKYDRIFSLGMFEHVGFDNYQCFFDKVDDCLSDDGLFLLHTIGHRKTSLRVDPWIAKYIFPNSVLPSSELICRNSAPNLIIEDWHNFGLDYYKTLMAWWENLNQAWEHLPEHTTRFQKMWHYYLMASAGSFKASRNHLWQIVFSKGEYPQPYQAVRTAV